MNVWLAVNILFLLIGAGAILAYREQVKQLEHEVQEMDLDTTWRRVFGTHRAR